MSTKKLINELDKKLQKLQLLHDEIGTASDKQDEQLRTLFNQMLHVADQHHDQIAYERESLEGAIKAEYQRISALKRLMGEYVDDSVTYSNSLLSTLHDLKVEREIVEKHYQKRLDGVIELQHEINAFVDSLESFVNTSLIVHESIDVSLPAVTALEEETRRCQNEHRARKQRVNESAKRMIDLWLMLGLAPQSDRDSAMYQLHDDIPEAEKNSLYAELIKDEGLRYIAQRITELEDIRQEREFRKQEVIQHLSHLWERLKIPAHDRESFLAGSNGLKKEDIEKYEVELDRLTKLKAERIQEFIFDARQDLNRLWDQLYFSVEERQEFDQAFKPEYNDAILGLHENEIARLRQLIQDRKPILEKVESHMKLLEEIKDFEEITNDPSRLFSKGRRDPGRLLREEKFRKRIARELPKSKDELVRALVEHEVLTGNPFYVYGKPYIKQIMSSDDGTNARKKKINPNADTGSSSKSTENNGKTAKQRRLRYDLDDDTEIYYNKAATSPGFKSPSSRFAFRTPQPTRTLNFNSRLAERSRRLRTLKHRRDDGDDEGDDDDEPSILHRVRENNICKRRANAVRVKNLRNSSGGSSDDRHTLDSLFSDVIPDENTAPSSSEAGSEIGGGSIVDLKLQQQQQKQQLVVPPAIAATSSSKGKMLMSDDDFSVNLDIFDDGPELSDLSADES
ncbi:microtubule associated protein-domain-containing protein [Zychaea mexicana]|uniref:microtubule associated protein-domain-containing protein n=1 Tax=Zychaea mexicana TaxID=64656 RepID=UPI0022FE3F1F|nr:microtubule associated protein-domain-containing protein [Zychaea mexicana]KAI9491376.1 microtubule associated protein-domain-containing protein [Zychaea mexicana]